MRARVLILEAGHAPSNNLIRSLKAGDPSLVIIGCGESAFFLNKSPAERNYVLPLSTNEYGAALRRIVETERIDLIIATTDADVLRLASLRGALRSRTFLPARSVVQRCQDKYALTVFLAERGIPVPRTHLITDAGNLEELFRLFGSASTLWCRIRAGSGSAGAIPVKNPEQVRAWLAVWAGMRALPPESFTLAEYLPGRDYCVQCIWNKGQLVLAKMAERITYLDNGSPSGQSSMPALAKTVFDARAMEVSVSAIRALDPRASGVFFVDLKENERGDPCITEINAGRFATMTNIHDLAGKHNMAATYVRVALGRRVRIPNAFDFADGFYLVRSIDTLPAMVRKEELFTKVTRM